MLLKAEELSIESVSLPVLGGDVSKFTIGVTAMIMILAIKTFLEEN
jgi:O-acetyl-ADP-ribose deacetylase (regulator of RNase III)